MRSRAVRPGRRWRPERGRLLPIGVVVSEPAGSTEYDSDQGGSDVHRQRRNPQVHASRGD